jgi:hypothetical protein
MYVFLLGGSFISIFDEAKPSVRKRRKAADLAEKMAELLIKDLFSSKSGGVR